MNNTLEYRSYDMMDAKVDKEKRIIQGRAVVYNSMSNELRTSNGDKFKEIIQPGALSLSLERNDILAFKEHNPEMLLGRKSAGTLMLEDRNDGLYVTINVPETSYGEDTLISAMRGDLKGFSFGFNNPKTKAIAALEKKIREISSMNLREVSVVANPAYSETSLNVRSEDFVEETKEPVQVVIENKQQDNETNLRFKFITLTHK